MFNTAEDIRKFATAGKALFTAQSVKTSNRFTFKVSASKNKEVHFVSVLTGANNESDYSYLGIIDKSGNFRRTAKSKINDKSPSHMAFRWIWEQTAAGKLPGATVINHEGRCGRCGRLLTVPESVASGFGPECIGKI